MTTTQFVTYLQEVLVDGSQAIYVEIKQNNVCFFRSKNVGNSKNKEKMKSIQTCSKVVINLFIALFSAAKINIFKPVPMDCIISNDIVLPISVDYSTLLGWKPINHKERLVFLGLKINMGLIIKRSM